MSLSSTRKIHITDHTLWQHHTKHPFKIINPISLNSFQQAHQHPSYPQPQTPIPKPKPQQLQHQGLSKLKSTHPNPPTSHSHSPISSHPIPIHSMSWSCCQCHTQSSGVGCHHCHHGFCGNCMCWAKVVLYTFEEVLYEGARKVGLGRWERKGGE